MATLNDTYDYTYVYLSSPTHTGSTLLGFLLGAHPQVATIGEIAFQFSDEVNCSCGTPFCKCPYWTDWQRRVREKGLPFNIGRLEINLQPGKGSGFAESLFYYEFSYRWMNSIRNMVYCLPGLRQKFHVPTRDAIERSYHYAGILCEREKTPVFLDTSKNPYQTRFLAGNKKIRLKLIYMLRDARAQINSNMKRENRTLNMAIKEYKWATRNIERDIAHYMRPEDVFRIRYEDLCDAPDAIMKSLYRFLGIDTSYTIDRLNLENTGQFHIIGNVMRLNFDGKITYDTKWKQELTPEQIARIDREVGYLNRRYGYEE